MRTSTVLLVSLLAAILLGGCGGESTSEQTSTEEDTVALTVPEGAETTTITSSEVEQKAEEARQTAETKGVSKAGQDISNIPVREEVSPEEVEDRVQCLTNYYSSLPSDQRRQISQQVVEQANAQGVTPADIVGCSSTRAST